MGFFPQTAAAAVAAREIRMARLVELDFADGAGLYWEGGTGSLQAGGRTWRGTGQFGAIGGIESALGGTAPQVKLSLSGVDAGLVGEMIGAETSVKGRDCTIYVQFFDDSWAPLDAPYAVFLGLMDVMSASVDSGKATIALTVESLFARRSRPVWGYLTDRSQQGLFPGDRGLALVPSMRLASPKWPVGV